MRVAAEAEAEPDGLGVLRPISSLSRSSTEGEVLRVERGAVQVFLGSWYEVQDEAGGGTR